MLQEFTTYRRGTTSPVTWFGPVQRPRMGPLGYQPMRYGDTMWLPAPGWGDSGAGHIGDAHGNFGVKDRVTLYQGDQELDSATARNCCCPAWPRSGCRTGWWSTTIAATGPTPTPGTP